jgi:hypothetical protein
MIMSDRDHGGDHLPRTAWRPGGFVWEGKPYSSLSAIARAMTGTVWNGPRFFAVNPALGNDPPVHGGTARTRPH